MAEIQTGFYKFLSSPLVYNEMRKILRLDKIHKNMIQEFVDPKPSESFLDVGCGPGEMAAHLPNNDYLGIDYNSNYIEYASRTFGSERHKFLCGGLDQVIELCDNSTFDTILAFGVLHHLSDEEVLDLFSSARILLKPTGKMITVDPCLFEGQNPLTRFIVKNDRGKNIRQREEYFHLARKIFGPVELFHRSSIFPFPYSCEILRCRVE